jgi:hypothetical protein
MRAALLTLSCVALLAFASTAQAAERYASPVGVGLSCKKELPCQLRDALEKAEPNDEVIVAPGDYELGGSPINVKAKGVYLHGEFGKPMPRILASVSMAPIRVHLAGGDNAHVAYLEVVNSANGAWGLECWVGGGDIERVRVTVTGDPAVGIQQGPNCSVRDSLITASGKLSRALYAESSLGETTATGRNLTLIATGPESRGASVSYFQFPGPGSSGSIRLNLKNSIVSGDGYDLFAGGFGGAGAITVGNSNFDTQLAQAPFGSILDAGGNQSGAPLFVGPAAGDYREAGGSPTIDAGVVDQLGTLDLGGNPRLLGAAPDIGAYEFVPGPTSTSSTTSGAAASSAGEIHSLQIAPRLFAATAVGGAVLSLKKPPLGATVTYELSNAATVAFSVERKRSGRKVGKACVKETKANKGKKKCPIFKPVKGGFSHSGVAGANTFKFSGRLARALAPGSYRLTGRTTSSSRTADFRIVK